MTNYTVYLIVFAWFVIKSIKYFIHNRRLEPFHILNFVIGTILILDREFLHIESKLFHITFNIAIFIFLIVVIIIRIRNRSKRRVTFNIKPYEGYEEQGTFIKFGMSKSEVYNLIGEPIRKNALVEFFTAHQIEFRDEKVVAIQFMCDEANIIFDEVNLSKLSIKVANEYFKNLDPNVSIENYSGLISRECGIATYTPYEEEIEAIFIFKRGYYDQYLQNSEDT